MDNQTKRIAALFDFDGVIMDTEKQYSRFWRKIGQEYLGMDHLEARVKGQTLVNIYREFFPGRGGDQEEITAALDRFEQEMDYDYIPGAPEFIAGLRRKGVHTAIVTSSNEQKMAAVYRVHPEVRELCDRILTAEMFAHSKPHPDCFLLGMKVFGVLPENTFVFEDSFNGLKAGMASGATVIGLATTNSREEIAPLCHRVIDDFKDLSVDFLFS